MLTREERERIRFNVPSEILDTHRQVGSLLDHADEADKEIERLRGVVEEFVRLDKCSCYPTRHAPGCLLVRAQAALAAGRGKPC